METILPEVANIKEMIWAKKYIWQKMTYAIILER